MCLAHKKYMPYCNILSDERLVKLAKAGVSEQLTESIAYETIAISNNLRGSRENGPQFSRGNNSFMRSTTGISRRIFDAKRSWRQFDDADLVWIEGGSYTGEDSGRTDASEAFNYTKDVYDFLFNELNRNSIDDSGMSLLSTIRYRENYVNANWNGYRNDLW